MRKPKTITATLIAAFAFSVLAASPASAGWFVEGEELASGSTAALATAAKVSEEPVLTFAGVTIKCSGSTLNSVKPELVAPNKLTASSLSFSGCSASGEECTLEKSEIGTLPLTAELTEQTYPEDQATFKPKTGTLLATIKFTTSGGCLDSGEKVALTGSGTATLPTGQEENNTQTIKANTTKTSGTLKVGSIAAGLTGAAGLQLATEGLWRLQADDVAEIEATRVAGKGSTVHKCNFENTNDTCEIKLVEKKIIGGVKLKFRGDSFVPLKKTKLEFEQVTGIANECTKGAVIGAECRLKVKYKGLAPMKEQFVTGDLMSAEEDKAGGASAFSSVTLYAKE
jgi:hypothetical protein